MSETASSENNDFQHTPERLSGRIIAFNKGYRVNRSQYLQETSPQKRKIMQEELAGLIIELAKKGESIYLEGLGVMYPEDCERCCTYTFQQKAMIRVEDLRTLKFEKAGELTQLTRERFPRLIETNRLADMLYLRLPLSLQFSWDHIDVRRYLRGMFKDIKYEVIVQGYSNQLEEVGCFYSLHNRQGNSFSDWFAGADIFLTTSWSDLLRIKKKKIINQPVLRNAWEIFEVAYGKPLKTFKVDLNNELRELGYGDINLSESSGINSEINLAVFQKPGSVSGSEENLLYVSDGVRLAAFNHSQRVTAGNEFVLQLPVTELKQIPAVNPDTLAARMFTMAWILMQSSRSKTVAIGAGLSSETPIVPSCKSKINTVFVNDFYLLPAEQLSDTGTFKYLALIGITADEARIASQYSPRHLRAILKHRGLDQITRPLRSSIVKKSVFTKVASVYQDSLG
ncbi:MAG: hypothetical protein D6719_05025 [Candidatus Dadabacteria bacterium]|nr:MAG: hypothetical protein D6719_05025 [Candidatus Dadabacteria bacterium]